MLFLGVCDFKYNKMDKYINSKPGIWNTNGLRHNIFSEIEPLWVNAPDLKSYKGLFLASYIIDFFLFILIIYV